MKTVSSKILILFVFFALFFLNYPWLSMFSVEYLFAGVPVLYLYLFVVWLVTIVAIAVLTEMRKEPIPRKRIPSGEQENA